MVFFLIDAATTEIYTLSLHDALPILMALGPVAVLHAVADHVVDRYLEVADAFERDVEELETAVFSQDRKSTRLNSSHVEISYAVFCLKKKKKYHYISHTPPTPLPPQH